MPKLEWLPAEGVCVEGEYVVIVSLSRLVRITCTALFTQDRGWLLHVRVLGDYAVTHYIGPLPELPERI